MKYVDLIIKYLSDEMTPEESGSFEQEVRSNKELRDEFDRVSAAWKLVSNRLRKMDEEAFRSKLRQAMRKADHTPAHPFRRRHAGWFLVIPFAASIALLMALFIMNRDRDQLYARFFDPAGDPVLESFNQVTRGETGSAISLYNQGSFEEAGDQMRSLLAADPRNQLALLYLLLTNLELDKSDEALEMILSSGTEPDHRLGQALTWYASLALVKWERFEEAAGLLHPLVSATGPYQLQAKRLEKMLLK